LTPAELIWTGTLENNSTARPEGPHLYKVNGTYYLLIAEGKILSIFKQTYRLYIMQVALMQATELPLREVAHPLDHTKAILPIPFYLTAQTRR